MMKTIAVPTTPLILLTGITQISVSTGKDQARAWTKELETLYDAHFQDDKRWTWDDVHDLDRDAFYELELIVEANDQLPLVEELISSFLTPDWRERELLKVQKNG